MSTTNRLLVILNSLLALILIMVIGAVNTSTAQARQATVVASPKAIRACVAKKTGVLRISPKCKKTETALSWAIQGPQGKPGTAGAQGIPGTTGDTGPAGAAATVTPRSILTPTNLCDRQFVTEVRFEMLYMNSYASSDQIRCETVTVAVP